MVKFEKIIWSTELKLNFLKVQKLVPWAISPDGTIWRNKIDQPK